MNDSMIGFLLCLGVFSVQLGLTYFLTAACIDGMFPRRDILLFPLVILTIAGVFVYTLHKVLVMEPDLEHLRTTASLYAVCLGAFLGVCGASVARRGRLIQLAVESREHREWSGSAV